MYFYIIYLSFERNDFCISFYFIKYLVCIKVFGMEDYIIFDKEIIVFFEWSYDEVVF